MRKYLEQTDWNILMDKDDVKTMWNIFKQKIHEAVEIFVSKKTRKRHKKLMWWNWNVYSARKKKLRWWMKYCESKQYQDYLKYKRALNRATNVVKKAKGKLECNLAKNVKSNPKGFFKYARSKTRSKDKVGPLTDENGDSITNDSKTADVLNEYFSSVFTQDILENLPNPKQIFTGEDGDILDNVNLSPDEILKKLTVLKPKKAPGVDLILPVVLKEVASMISPELDFCWKFYWRHSPRGLA